MADFKYQERIEGAQEAIKRSRWVFLILTIVSLALLITAWNAYFSWTREIPLTYHSWTEDAVAAHLQQHLTEEWVKSQMIDIPVLGIHIGISDAAPLGGFGVFILSIWFFFSTRRENRTIAELLIDTLHDTDEVRARIFHSVASYLVFLTIANSDDPISSLEAPVRREKPFATLRLVVKMLFFLAPLTIFTIVACDTASIFWLAAPYRQGHKPLINSQIPNSFWVEWGSIEVTALALAGWAAFLCFKALRFTGATGKILNEYSKLVGGAARED
jgi:hypothetical protein